LIFWSHSAFASKVRSLPICDPDTLESNVPGIYLAGVILAGSRTNEIFIENGRFHGRQIAKALAASNSSVGLNYFNCNDWITR